MSRPTEREIEAAVARQVNDLFAPPAWWACMCGAEPWVERQRRGTLGPPCSCGLPAARVREVTP
jgi:hypothetical protein